MAIHRFTCRCNEVVEDITTKGIHICPRCGAEMAMDCRIAIHGNYQHPVHSDSLAIMPSQVAEHKQLFPNIELDDEQRPIFDNYTEHQKYLDATGFQKLPQKIRRAGAEKIDTKTDR